MKMHLFLRGLLEKKNRTCDFLIGLNVEFDAVRVQTLRKEDMSSLSETIAIILNEKGTKNVMIEIHLVEGSTLMSKTISASAKLMAWSNVEFHTSKQLHLS